MKSKKLLGSRGFTLVELLVVIAIIAILAAIALASLNSARIKAADSAVKGGLSNISAQAEIFYDGDGGGSYGISADCSTSPDGMFADATIVNMMTNIKKNASSTAAFDCSTDSLGQKWAIAISPTRSNESWCIDNQGKNVRIQPSTTGTQDGSCN